jgi:CHAD domain-containing protein
MASAHDWPGYCRTLLASSVAAAAERFPGRGEEAPERVHSVRKTLKESRALARLFLPSVGEPARVTIAALAVVRRRVGRARDLDVMESRLERLVPPPEISGPLREAIAREREAAQRAHTSFAAAASRAQLNSIVKRLDRWDVTRVADADIAEAVARTYRQGLRRGRLAFEGGDPEALHALRSRVVDLRHQLSALSPAWPAALNAQSEELNALRDTLGDFNDLTVLGRFAAERGGLAAEALAGLIERLEAKKTKLQRRAAIAFDRLFAETPDAFSVRLAAYLRHPIGKLAPVRRVPVKRAESALSAPA